MKRNILVTLLLGLVVPLPVSAEDYVVVRFAGPILREQREAVAQCGRIVGYVPSFQYVVEFPTSSSRVCVERSVGVVAVRDYAVAEWGPNYQKADLWVLPDGVQERGKRPAATAPILGYARRNRGALLNDVVQRIISATVWSEVLELDGATQWVAIADSGLADGDFVAATEIFNLRHTAALGRTFDWSDHHGHGTHVAGVIAGRGQLQGIAPEAQIMIQALEKPDGSLAIPDDLTLLFSTMYNLGARIQNNSWGDVDASGDYDLWAQSLDSFIWQRPDYTIICAAGNSGADADGDGVVDLFSVLSPGTAKNCITVGATESRRVYDSVWGDFGFMEYPLTADLVADDIAGMAAFSSRGPTDDGRIKPDLVAPGTAVISRRSRHPEAHCGWQDYDEDYCYSGGTSTSAPVVTGLVTLLREWYEREQGVDNPSAALLKASLLALSQDIAPGQYGEVPAERPNFVSGWGRASLAGMDALWWRDVVTGVNTADVAQYVVRPPSTTETVHITLAWSDYPAMLLPGPKLVNDLDLEVTDGKRSWYGNQSSIAGDHVNNVETVYLDTLSAEVYTVTVRAYNVPQPEQPYAVVMAGGDGKTAEVKLDELRSFRL